MKFLDLARLKPILITFNKAINEDSFVEKGMKAYLVDVLHT